MARLEKLNGKIPIILIACILLIIAGFIIIGCGTDPQLKIQDPDVGQCAVDFSLDTTNVAAIIAPNANFPSIAGNTLTLEAWVRPGAPTSTDAQGIFSRYGSAGAFLYVQGGKPKFALRQVTPSPPAAATSTDYTVSGTTVMVEDTWYHIAGVVVNEDHGDGVGTDDHLTITCLKGDGTAGGESEPPHLDIYVNGILEACATTWDNTSFPLPQGGPQGVSNPSVFGSGKDTDVAYIGTLPGVPGLLVSGNTSSSIRQFQGAIDEVRMWTAARSEADIAACKDAELTSSGACALNPDILKGYWKMNECKGSNVLDWSGAGSAGGIDMGFDPWTGGWIDGAF